MASEDISKDDELHFETEMLDFYKAKVVSEDLGIVKKIINEGQRWESPREPYEVTSWYLRVLRWQLAQWLWLYKRRLPY